MERAIHDDTGWCYKVQVYHLQYRRKLQHMITDYREGFIIVA